MALFPAVSSAVSALKTTLKLPAYETIKALDGIASVVNKERTQNAELVSALVADQFVVIQKGYW